MPDSHKPTERSPEEKFALLMKERREALGWSQDELARRVTAATGVTMHQTAVTRIEGLQRNIRLNEVVTLAQVLGIKTGIFDDPNPTDEQKKQAILAELRRLEDLRTELDEQAYRAQTDMDQVRTRYDTVLNRIEKANADIRRWQVLLDQVEHGIAEQADGE